MCPMHFGPLKGRVKNMQLAGAETIFIPVLGLAVFRKVVAELMFEKTSFDLAVSIFPLLEIMRIQF